MSGIASALTESVTVVGETIGALVTAFRIRALGRDFISSMPTTAEKVPAGLPVSRIVSHVDTVVCVLLFWKPGKCFYRSYALATILRKRGLPLVFNFGAIDGDNKEGLRAHCWLSLDGQPFAEKGDPGARFPDHVGEYAGQVVYWMGYPEETGRRRKDS